MLDVPTIVDVVESAAPGTNVAVVVRPKLGLVSVRVLTSAFVDFNVQVETPETLVAVHAERVLPVPEEVNTGVIELMGWDPASLSVIVMVAKSVLSAVYGPLVEIVEVTAEATPGLNVTVVVMPKLGLVTVRVLTSGVVDLI